jgi:phytoene dehydrogenase-like protein
VAAAAREAGAEVRVNAPVRRILLEEAPGAALGAGAAAPARRAVGVELESGEVVRAQYVLSSAPPSTTFLKLLDAGASAALPADFRRQIETLNVVSGSAKINLALSRLPSFACAPNGAGDAAQPHHRGTIHFETEPAQIEAAFRDAAGGQPSARPVVEMTLPSVLDPSIAPAGKHVCLLFCQYAPYSAYDGLGWDAPGARARFAASVYAVIEEYAPGFTASIEGQDILTPLDLERVFGLPGGNIFHGAMGLDQLFFNRPAPGFARYRSPVAGLYVCGAGAHPGGGVMGAAGRNAAQVVLNDMVAQR